MNDTPPEIAEKVREIIRAKTPLERIQMASDMYDFCRYIATLSILQKKPDISPVELKQQLFLRFYGHEFSAEEKEKILKRLAETVSD